MVYYKPIRFKAVIYRMADPQNNQADRLKLPVEMDIDTADAFETIHKKAFRTSFDFLHACFPPTWSEEYWNAMFEKFKHNVEDDPNNLLMKHLTVAVINYMNDIVKDLPKEKTK